MKRKTKQFVHQPVLVCVHTDGVTMTGTGGQSGGWWCWGANKVGNTAGSEHCGMLKRQTLTIRLGQRRGGGSLFHIWTWYLNEKGTIEQSTMFPAPNQNSWSHTAGRGFGVCVRISNISCPLFTGTQGLAECSPGRKWGGCGHTGYQLLVEGWQWCLEVRCMPGGAGTRG